MGQAICDSPPESKTMGQAIYITPLNPWRLGVLAS